MQFSSLDLSDPILKAIAEQGYDKPSPIQEKAIPAVLAGKDVMAAPRKQVPVKLLVLLCLC